MGAIPTIPIPHPKELILRIHHTIHIVSFLKLLTRWRLKISATGFRFHVFFFPALCCFLQRNSAALQSLFNVLETWHGRPWQNDEYMEGWKVSSLTLTVALRALRSTWTTSMSCCNTLQWQKRCKINFFDSGTEMKPQVDHISQDPKIPNKMIMQNAKHWFRVPAWLVKVKRQFILQDIAAAEAAPKPPHISTRSTRFVDIMYMFHVQKWQCTLEKRLGNSCRTYQWQLVSWNLICYECLESKK